MLSRGAAIQGEVLSRGGVLSITGSDIITPPLWPEQTRLKILPCSKVRLRGKYHTMSFVVSRSTVDMSMSKIAQ